MIINRFKFVYLLSLFGFNITIFSYIFNIFIPFIIGVLFASGVILSYISITMYILMPNIENVFEILLLFIFWYIFCEIIYDIVKET